MNRRRFFLALAAANVALIVLLDGYSRVAAVFGLIGCLLYAASSKETPR